MARPNRIPLTHALKIPTVRVGRGIKVFPKTQRQPMPADLERALSSEKMQPGDGPGMHKGQMLEIVNALRAEEREDPRPPMHDAMHVTKALALSHGLSPGTLMLYVNAASALQRRLQRRGYPLFQGDFTSLKKAAASGLPEHAEQVLKSETGPFTLDELAARLQSKRALGKGKSDKMTLDYSLSLLEAMGLVNKHLPTPGAKSRRIVTWAHADNAKKVMRQDKNEDVLILKSLRKRPGTAEDIAKATGMTAPNIRQRLELMRGSELVRMAKRDRAVPIKGARLTVHHLTKNGKQLIDEQAAIQHEHLGLTARILGLKKIGPDTATRERVERILRHMQIKEAYAQAPHGHGGRLVPGVREKIARDFGTTPGAINAVINSEPPLGKSSWTILYYKDLPHMRQVDPARAKQFEQYLIANRKFIPPATCTDILDLERKAIKQVRAAASKAKAVGPTEFVALAENIAGMHLDPALRLDYLATVHNALGNELASIKQWKSYNGYPLRNPHVVSADHTKVGEIITRLQRELADASKTA